MARTLRKPIFPRRVLVPRGASRSSMETAYGSLPGTNGPDYIKTGQSEAIYYAQNNWPLMRLAISWPRLQPTPGGAFDTTYQGYITEGLDQAVVAGIKVLIEFHDYAGMTVSGSMRKINDASGLLTYAHFNNLATRFATQFASHAGFWGIDPMNEPTGLPVGTTPSNYLSTATWTIAGQGFINAWRAVDTSKYIVMENDHFSSLPNFFTNHGANPQVMFTDPQNKMYISPHVYFDADNSGSFSGDDAWYSGTGMSIYQRGNELKAMCDWAIGRNFYVNGKPAILVGEVNINNNVQDPMAQAALEDFMNVADDYEVPVLLWATGPYYNSPPNANSGKPCLTVFNRHLGTIN